MPPRPHTGRLVPLVLLIATTAALLAGCSLSTPLCEEGNALVAAGQPARALEVYARAQMQGDGCAEEGMQTASTHQRQSVEEAARGEATERAGDVPAATAAYQTALTLDVTNELAVTGLARLGQPEPIPPPPVATQPPSRSWWAGPWPYLLGPILISALLAGAVLWLVRSKLGTLKAEGTRSRNLVNAMDLDLVANQGRLTQLESHTRTGRELINTLEQHSLACTQAIESVRRELDTVRDAGARADRACTGLDRALRRQKERIDQLTKLIDLFAETQAEPTSETVVRFERRPLAGAPAHEGGIDEERADGTEDADSATSAETKRVEVNLFAIRIGHGEAVEEKLVVQRVIEREQVAEFWVTPDHQGLAAGAKWVQDMADDWHGLVLGNPAEKVTLGTGFSLASADIIEAIVAKIPLSGDNTACVTRRLAQYSGIVLGAVGSAPLLTKACVTSLVRDVLAELAAKGIHKAIGSMLTLVDREISPIPANELEPDSVRVEQLRSRLVDAASWQRTHELEMQDTGESSVRRPETPRLTAPHE